ncbi:uncharacterized protein LOC120012119 [Tripterygium wilfordii]|uniref:uncharacterized protein LOC120012119 n=1 Tax=Tripterygium wilfordii TaxID=458696 RepID=UPI0018F861AE|nr:uncharacterized protein LOC120012119 [Tripterygium wilfordii]
MQEGRVVNFNPIYNKFKLCQGTFYPKPLGDSLTWVIEKHPIEDGECSKKSSCYEMLVDLPYHVLVLIGKKLTIADHLSFRAVCKDWRLVSKICRPLQFTTESLWLMFLRNPRRKSAQWKIYTTAQT